MTKNAMAQDGIKTQDLIAALARDGLGARASVGRGAALALSGAALLAAALFYAAFDLRPGLTGAAAMATAMKLAIALSLVAAGLWAALGLARPGAPQGARLAALAAPLALLLAALIGDLAANGLVDWRARLFGQTSMACVLLVIVLSAPPLVALVAALRRGAPDRPTLAGLVAGLTAAGVGASIYALHCPEDSPLFFATWYGAATLVAALAGAGCGRWLRW